MNSKMLYKIFRTKDVVYAQQKVVQKAKNSYLRGYTTEEIEDAMMNALIYISKRCKKDAEYERKLSMSTLTFRMRSEAIKSKWKESGLTTRGSIPKSGRRFYIQNMYSKETGDNLVEVVGVDQDGNILTPDGWRKED